MKKALLFTLLLTMVACAYVDPSITDQTKIYSDAPVRKSSLQVSVHPRTKQYRPLTAYFHPFVIQQQNSDYWHLSTQFAEIFQYAWAEERLFPVLEFEPGKRYEGLTAALRTAKRHGADLLVLGTVPYFYAGHTLDDTAITIKMDIYSTATGARLWTMAQSGRMEDKFPDDYIYFRHETRLSTGPFNEIIRAIAKDMAIPLKAWLPDPDINYGFAETDQEVQQLLAPPTPAAPGQKTGSETGMEQDLPADSAKDAASSNGDTTVRPHVNGVNLNIEFDFDKATIKQESYSLLDSLGEALNTPDLKGKSIIIAGHTDAKGSQQYNLALSKKRAQSVKTYLVNKWAVAPELIEAVGYGKSRPLNKGKTAEEQQRNRRVEVRLAQ